MKAATDENANDRKAVVNYAHGQKFGEGFICPVCLVKCLSPEALLTHFQGEHDLPGNGRNPTYRIGRKRIKSKDCIVIKPTFSASQVLQLKILWGFSYFWKNVGQRTLTEDVKDNIFQYSRADDYYSYINFRTPAEYSSSLWTRSGRAKAQKLQFKHQKSLITRSLTSPGVHPVHPFSKEMVDLSRSKEIDKNARRMFKLVNRFTDPCCTELLSEFPTAQTCLVGILHIIERIPKLTNELYAQIFKQMNFEEFSTKFSEDAIIDRTIRRRVKEDDKDDRTGQGYASWSFGQTITRSGHPVYAMNKVGALKYMQLLYAVCHTSLPTKDFFPFVIQRLKGFTMGDANGLIDSNIDLKVEEQETRKLEEDEIARRRGSERGASCVRPPTSSRFARQNSPRKYKGTTNVTSGRQAGRRLENAYKFNIGRGIIANYANCCVDLLLRSAVKGNPGGVKVECSHIAHILRRPPVIVRVEVEGGGRGRVADVDHHVAPWETNAVVKRAICGELSLTKAEQDSSSLYVYLPQTSEAGGCGSGNLTTADSSLPLPVPSTYYLGDLGMNDNVCHFRVVLRRKLFFGLPMVRVMPTPVSFPPTPNLLDVYFSNSHFSLPSSFFLLACLVQGIGIRPGAKLDEPLDTRPMSEAGEGALFMQLASDYGTDGISYGEGIFNETSGGTMGEVWEREMGTVLSRMFLECKEAQKDDEKSALDVACLVNCRISMSITLRRTMEDDPVSGVGFVDRDLGNLGVGAVVDRAYRAVPDRIRRAKPKQWWERELGEITVRILRGVRDGAVAGRNLQRAVLYTIGSHALAGGQHFCVTKMPPDGRKEFGPLSALEVGEGFWLIMNHRGLHVCGVDGKGVISTVAYDEISSWSGDLSTINLFLPGSPDDVVLRARCGRATVFRQVLLEIIQGLIEHQREGVEEVR